MGSGGSPMRPGSSSEGGPCHPGPGHTLMLTVVRATPGPANTSLLTTRKGQCTIFIQ